MHSIFILMFEVTNLFKQLDNLCLIIRFKNYGRHVFKSVLYWSQYVSLFYNLVVVKNRNCNEQHRDNDHSFDPWIHRFLENIKITVILWHPFNVSFLVEPTSVFYIIIRSLLIDDLIRCAHLKEASRGIIVTIQNSFDYSLNFWSLN